MRNPRTAICALSGALHQRLAFVAVLAAIAADANEIQLMPAGEFRAIDGRPGEGRSWRIDRAIAEKLIARHAGRANPIAIDYEHQTLFSKENGQPAPAAGWITALEWRDGQGLFAKVEWTARARAAIAGKEYRYISPVFAYDPETLAPLELAPAALVNYPGIDGMQEVALSAIAEKFDRTFSQENTMKELLAAILAALGIPETTKPEAAAATVAALKAQAAEADALKAKVAELEPKAAKVTELEASVAALKAGAPDPAKFVPIETVKTLQTQVAALTNAHQEREIDDLVEVGLSDGKLLPDMEKWARDLGKKSIADLKAYLDSAAPIAALAGTQTGGKRPKGTDAGKDPLAIAKAAQKLMDEEAKAGRILSSNDAVNRVTSEAAA